VEIMTNAVHGALLDVHGVGTALLGSSGVGKSECALELLGRGHRLVADDVIELTVVADVSLIGRAPERIRHYMEIRGLGIVFIPELFGGDSVRDEAVVELICRLERWREDVDYERVGIERPTEELAGVKLPWLRLPARPGGSMATVVEVAAREHRQRLAGVNAARRLDQRLRKEMSQL
jgi:HPr kinase/phosphorylase